MSGNRDQRRGSEQAGQSGRSGFRDRLRDAAREAREDIRDGARSAWRGTRQAIQRLAPEHRRRHQPSAQTDPETPPDTRPEGQVQRQRAADRTPSPPPAPVRHRRHTSATEEPETPISRGSRRGSHGSGRQLQPRRAIDQVLAGESPLALGRGTRRLSPQQLREQYGPPPVIRLPIFTAAQIRQHQTWVENVERGLNLAIGLSYLALAEALLRRLGHVDEADEVDQVAGRLVQNRGHQIDPWRQAQRMIANMFLQNTPGMTQVIESRESEDQSALLHLARAHFRLPQSSQGGPTVQSIEGRWAPDAELEAIDAVGRRIWGDMWSAMVTQVISDDDDDGLDF